MVSRTRLYDAFGELIYAIAIADGVVNPEELDALKEILKEHPWGEEIQWSFNYEMKKENALKDSYLKALDTLKENGPDPEYLKLVEIVEKVAHAKDGMDSKEGRMISIFQKTLRSHFLKFLDDNQLK